ncbi:MAG: phytanoyl-CoA dioxygenase family protein [Gammaproteobacteria bacterium]|nr:phytanoyl-CoA dioxygenase family protein [Gammaproteobacteria bacterium]
MQFGEFENTKEFNATFKRIGELGLERNIFELDSYGFTVVPPDKVAERKFFERIRATVLRICKDRTGVDFALERNGEFGHYKAQPQGGGQFLLFYLLMADRIFEEWIVNPTLYTLINYLMRGQQQLSSLTSFVKWKGERDTLGLHSDSPPDRDGRMPPCSDVANAAYCLTDYTLDNGAIAMVPGSHTYCRQPKPGEGEDMAVPVEAEAGSLIVWHGNIWHGAFEKKTDGLRLNVTSYHCHRRLKTQERYQWHVTQEMIDRNPPEFARLVGADDNMGWDESGPDYGRTFKYATPEQKERFARLARRSKEKAAA